MKVNSFLESFPTNSLSWDELTFDGGQTKNIHYGLIHKGLPVITNTNDERIPFLKNENASRKRELVKSGDIIFADASEDYEGVAQAIEIGNVINPTISGLHTIHTREKDYEFSRGFKGYLFNSPTFKKQVKVLAVGTKVNSISFKNFKDVTVSFPRSHEEQHKVFKLLHSIDNRIEMQRKLIDSYKSLIMGFKEKIASAHYPIIVRLNQLMFETNEKVNNRIITPVAVGVLGIRHRSEIFDKELSMDYSKNKIIRKNNLCFGIGTNKIVYDVLESDDVYCVSSAYKTFKLKNIDPSVLKVILDELNDYLSKKYMIVSARQGKSVDFEGLLSESIRIPNIEEQNEIASKLKVFKKMAKLLDENMILLLQLKNWLQSQMFI